MTSNIQPVAQNTPYAHPYGELMSEQNDWLRRIDEVDIADYCPLLLDYIDVNSWQAIKSIACLNQAAFSKLLEDSMYMCPYTQQRYVSMVPVMILTKNPAMYLKGVRISETIAEMACDTDWNTRHYAESIFEGKLSRIQKLLLGSGYTNMTLMSDGSNSIEQAVMDLSNGDKLVFSVFVWHNK